jgi:hypothetical protein
MVDIMLSRVEAEGTVSVTGAVSVAYAEYYRVRMTVWRMRVYMVLLEWSIAFSYRRSPCEAVRSTSKHQTALACT